MEIVNSILNTCKAKLNLQKPKMEELSGNFIEKLTQKITKRWVSERKLVYEEFENL